MKNRGKAAVLYGSVPPNAGPDERDTLCEVEAVSTALRKLGYRTRATALSLDIGRAASELISAGPAFVFNLVESVEARGRYIAVGPLLLEDLGLPYTGCKANAITATSNKAYAKSIMSLAGLPTPPWQEATAAVRRCTLKPPFILKPKWEHASVGLEEDAILFDRRLLRKRLRGLRPQDYFLEAFVEGREFNISLLGDEEKTEVLPLAEIDFSKFGPGKPRIVGYKAKWEKDSFEYANTPRVFDFPNSDRALLRELNRLSIATWKAFCLSGYARVDFRVDRQNRPWILEVNANPCISPDAGFAAAAAQSGLSYTKMVNRIIHAL